ncbi:hypothetical protein CUC43_31600 (plasmid) [Bacillus thuringiensis LM1212]|uniref:hypothetical protein n=1 Tax=Bacillus cereus group TaxID=86661 RepID=UPI00041A6202|nr:MULTISPECIES: hypothetical protein [Bacillus cereus group]AXY11206.1 hypothetical protein CUC43_31600 [Bacillus thuringiensis LM1212]QDF27411.1 hypothetical protein FJR70_32175 [Bacillus tropicus]QUG99091.1 hypothetical protein HCM98_29935 [Bacillus tropicus]
MHEIYMEAFKHEEKQCEKWEHNILQLQQELLIATSHLQHHQKEHERLKNMIDRWKQNDSFSL